MIARFFFPVDFLQGLYRDSPTRRHNNITRGLHIPGSVLPKLTPEIRFDTQAFLSLSLNGRRAEIFCFLSLSLSYKIKFEALRRAEIFCKMIARFFFPVDFLQGLYRDSPTRRHNNIRTWGLHIGPFTIGVSFCFAIATRVFLSGRFPTRFVQGQPNNKT